MLLSGLLLFVEHVEPLCKDSFVSSACLKFHQVEYFSFTQSSIASLNLSFLIMQCLQSVDVDFTKEHSVRAVQRFLDDSSKQFASKLFGYGNANHAEICPLTRTLNSCLLLPQTQQRSMFYLPRSMDRKGFSVIAMRAHILLQLHKGTHQSTTLLPKL